MGVDGLPSVEIYIPEVLLGNMKKITFTQMSSKVFSKEILNYSFHSPLLKIKAIEYDNSE